MGVGGMYPANNKSTLHAACIYRSPISSHVFNNCRVAIRRTKTLQINYKPKITQKKHDI
jgi:hypothetical protein